MGVPDSAQMAAILNDIDRAQNENRCVYVHCLGGVGRTGTVVGCWLARHGIAVGEDALHTIKLLRNYVEGRDLASPQTREQCTMVRHWEIEK